MRAACQWTKRCQQCGEEFSNTHGHGEKRWRLRRYCSRKCWSLNRTLAQKHSSEIPRGIDEFVDAVRAVLGLDPLPHSVCARNRRDAYEAHHPDEYAYGAQLATWMASRDLLQNVPHRGVRN